MSLPRDIFEFIARDIEGGGVVSNWGTDPGGLTKWGISQKAFPDLDIRSLTGQQAYDLYDQHYWQRVRGDVLPKPVGLIVFDCAVNQGAGVATRLLQNACGIPADGIIGTLTTTVAAKSDPRILVKEIAKLRLSRYLSMNNAIEEANERGWGNRLIEVMCKALSWANAS